MVNRMRENQYYRDYVEHLNFVFPLRDLLNVKDIQQITGQSKATIYRKYGGIIKDGKVFKLSFAKEVSKKWG